MEKKQQKQGDQKKQGKQQQEGGERMARQEELDNRSGLELRQEGGDRLESRLYKMMSIYVSLLKLMALAAETCGWVYLCTVILVILGACIYVFTTYTAYRLYQSCDALSHFSIDPRGKEERRKNYYTPVAGQIVCFVIFILTIVGLVVTRISECK